MRGATVAAVQVGTAGHRTRPSDPFGATFRGFGDSGVKAAAMIHPFKLRTPTHILLTTHRPKLPGKL